MYGKVIDVDFLARLFVFAPHVGRQAANGRFPSADREGNEGVTGEQCAQIGVIRLCGAVGRDVFKYVAEEMQHVTHGSNVFTAQPADFYLSGCLCFHDEDVGLVIWINA